ncbi:hypothetical protein SAY86_022162 [Trapa natans]|uniref:Rho GDP-dissociation inhibitor 1 n=1 Tax=Trapa natans TaxID=22666 RepID=A0AAN7M985_TRANT|nr:hypothetical protein SAY86_022162 [Trapa natans]
MLEYCFIKATGLKISTDICNGLTYAAREFGLYWGLFKMTLMYQVAEGIICFFATLSSGSHGIPQRPANHHKRAMGHDEDDGASETEQPPAVKTPTNVEEGDEHSTGMVHHSESEASNYATEDEEDGDGVVKKINLGPQCTLKEHIEKDKDDESLRRWKEQLLGSVDLASVGETLEPEVKFLSLIILSPGRTEIVLAIPEDGKPKGLWFSLKEGSRYSLKFSFEVKNNIVSGLRYTNTVWKTGVKGNFSLEVWLC